MQQSDRLMRVRLVLLVVCFCVVAGNAWSQSRDVGLSVSYFSPFVTQFGLRVGAPISWQTWEVEKPAHVSRRSIVVSPQLAFSARPDVRENLIVSTEIAWRQQKTNRSFYWAPSVSLGYLASFVTLGGSVDLGSGEFEKDKETRSFFLPTVNFEVGSKAWKQTQYFFKLFFGRKISAVQEDSGFLGFELGLTIPLISASNE